MKLKNKKEVKKPWGGEDHFTINEKSTVKILTIKPRQAFSLQKHKNRTEFWKILEGPLKITLGSKTIRAKKDQEFLIPKNTSHRAEAYSKPGRILEISLGNFKDKDITRLKDKYNRI